MPIKAAQAGKARESATYRANPEELPTQRKKDKTVQGATKKERPEKHGKARPPTKARHNMPKGQRREPAAKATHCTNQKGPEPRQGSAALES